MSEPDLTTEIARLRRMNAQLAAYREVSQRLLDASALEEVGSVVVDNMIEVFGAGGAVMLLAASARPDDPGPWTHGGEEAWQQVPAATRHGLLDLVLQDSRPVVATEVAALLARHGLPQAPSLRNLLMVPLRLGVLSLGTVIAYNLVTPENLPRYAEEAEALLGPVPSAISHTWLLEARGQQARLLDSIVENVDTQIAYLDCNFRFLRVNQAYARGAGHSEETLLWRNHFELFPNAENEAIFSRVRDTGEPMRFAEKPFVYADQPARGVTYWDWTLTPLKNTTGETEGLVLALTDRTDHVRRRQELERIQQERLREARVIQAILESISSAVFYLGPNRRIRLVNAAAEKALALPREQLLGVSLTEVVPGTVEAVPLLPAPELGLPLRGREFPLRLPHAPARDVTYWDWAVVPVLTRSGTMDGAVLTASEVTEEVAARHRVSAAERARAREARLFEITQESTDSNLVYFDRELRIVQANSAFAATARLRREEVLGRMVMEVLPEAGDLHVLLERARDTGESFVVHELARPPLPGMPPFMQYWDFAITSVRDERGEVEGVVVSAVDVTGQVMNREGQLEEERRRTRLAEALNAEMNHRVKNNLAMVAGLLQMQIADRPKGSEVVETVRQTISRLRAIAAVHEQLNETQLRNVEIVDALRRIAAASRQILASDQEEVSVQGRPVYLPSRSATALCVVANELITNAIKYGVPRRDGRRGITVTVGRESNKLRLGVWNSGNPVPEDFDLEAQAQMGLRLVHGIVVEQFGGAFSIAPADSGTLAQIVVDEAALRE